ncbi:polyketide synthase [Exophiala viscosa]|uniref:polyketide synthase n=1 Tax=Exophiala viscosa TaxID=2486360 RepID=UPI00219CF93C|nr:polyketide synthase [Exophiala viscosa]
MEEVYVFGDQTADCRAFFTKVFTRKDDVLLQSFLERAGDALRVENKYRSHPSKAVPNFSTVQELVDRYYRGEAKDAAVESALVCISQFTHFIGTFEERTPSYIPHNADARLVGLCTGLIAATAIASADSLTALVPLAVEAVRIAFRAGAHVGRVAEQIEGDSKSLSWSTIVAADEKSAQAALDAFHKEKGTSPTSKLWISASSATSVTISGPPSTKASLFEDSEFFRTHKNAPVSIYAPYHASHLHSQSDLDKILRPQTKAIFGNTTVGYPVCSSVTGQPIPGANGYELLQGALREVVVQPLRWDKVLKYCASGKPSEAKVFAVGPTNLSSSVVSALKAVTPNVTLEDQSHWNTVAAAGTQNSKRESDIAIVGYSGRFPDAADNELFWQLLEKGLDVHRPIPPDRFPVDTHTDPTSKKKNTSHTPFGNFIERPGLFDARFFNMSPREAAQTDPMQRLMLATGYEAMEMAGIVPGRTPSTKHDRIGTFYGQTSDDWREVNAAQDIDTYFISGGVRAFGPGRINYFFKFSGPSFSVDTACSSSFAAINVAITALRANECDTAFTGGANVLTNSDIFSGLSRGHFLSRTGSCKTWDNDADGYCRGDGVCTVILKRLDDAMADRDPILGVVRGIGTNHSAEAVSITHPCAENQSFLFDKVLKECNVPCNDVNYVEMHGTGTQAGDGIEMESVSSVFAPRQGRRRPDQPLYVGAVKSNIGHGEAVSGVSALIKVLLMLQKSKIPPHTGIKKQMNKNFAPDLKERNVNIAFQTTPFPRPAGGKRTVFINNFSAAGGNTAMLLQDGPEVPVEPTSDPRSTQVVTVSAKSLAAFKNTLSKYEAYLASNPNVGLTDLAYTVTARRSHYNYRAAFPVQSMSQLQQSLKAVQEQTHNPIPLASPQIAMAFTGQGSQYTGMGQKLYETSKQFRNDIEEFNEIALRQGLPSIMPLIDGSVEVQHLPPTIVQLGMCCIQMALTRLWATWGVTPSVVIGHSLGEYAALQAAGVLSIADTIYLVGMRAQLLEQKCTAGTHAMLAVRSPVGGLQDVVANSQGKIEIACINGVSDTVLSGTMGDIDTVAQKLADAGQKCTKLKLPFAFHSSQVDPILADFEKLATAVKYHAPRVPVISPLLSDVVSVGGVFDAFYLSRHCRKTVDFVGGLSSGMSSATISETSLWLEVGGHPLCASMIKSCLSTPTLATMRRDEDPWKIISTSMAGLYTAGKALNWDAFHKENESLRVLNDLPFYGYDQKNYWLQYSGDWLIHKGDYPKAIAPAPATAAPSAPVKARKYLSTSVQGIVSEEVKGRTVKIVAESDFAHPKLFPVIAGHLVNGSGLCPSTLYVDIAHTLINYGVDLVAPGEKVDINIGGMDNPAPLLLKNINQPESQIFRMNMTIDMDARKADFNVTSNNGKKDVVHAKCVIRFEDAAAWKEEWSKTSYLIQSRIDLLKHKMENGEADKVSRSMAYKLFGALVDYSDIYQGMQSVIFDGPEFEATSTIKLRAGPNDGDFFFSPYHVDSACHLSGFTVNATVNRMEECYISHGWGNLRFTEPLKHDKQYFAYVKMQPVAGSKMRAGDVYVFNENKEVIGVAGAVRFQCIPRKLMDVMMPKPKAAAAGKASVSAAPAASKVAASPVGKPAAPVQATVSAPAPKPKVKKSVKAPKIKAPTPPKASSGGLVARAFDIIAKEIDVEQNELNDDIQWADMGVDSLMSLTISGKFREDLELEVESTLFTDFASVGALRKHLSGMSAPEAVPAGDASSVSSADSGSESDEDTVESGITTPDTEDFPNKAAEHGKSAAVEAVAQAPSAATDGGDMIETIRIVIAQEMEMDLGEITDTTDLSNLGMDSLMALTVLGKLREEHEIDLDPTILADNPSLGHLRKALGLEKQKAAPAPGPARISASAPAPAPVPKTEVKQNMIVAPAAPPVEVVIQMPPATSVLLQGNPKTATKNLFLFPDGSGSATSYVSIPAIDSKNLAVYGLNCPFMKDPTSYTCGIEGVSKLYMEEVMRRQPFGPYILGGWSAGGVVAYEVTRQLADLQKMHPDKNFSVEKLILIDSPCPIRLEPLPARLHHFFDEIGLLGTGTGKTPNWLLPHFEYSIKALTAYRPELKSTRDFKAPPTLLIWATDGVCGKPGDKKPPPQADDPKSMKWLLENRTDFGPNGWDKLLGGEVCKMVTVNGNHFTMMKPPVAKGVGQFIRESLLM